MQGVDTRALTIKTRVHGTMRAALITGSDDGEAAIRLAKRAPQISDIIPIPNVSCKARTMLKGAGNGLR